MATDNVSRRFPTAAAQRLSTDALFTDDTAQQEETLADPGNQAGTAPIGPRTQWAADQEGEQRIWRSNVKRGRGQVGGSPPQ